MPYPIEKVTMMEVKTDGTPYNNLRQEDLRRDDTSQNPIKSTVVTTISGRVVYIPRKNQGE